VSTKSGHSVNDLLGLDFSNSESNLDPLTTQTASSIDLSKLDLHDTKEPTLLNFDSLVMDANPFGHPPVVDEIKETPSSIDNLSSIITKKESIVEEEDNAKASYSLSTDLWSTEVDLPAPIQSSVEHVSITQQTSVPVSPVLADASLPSKNVINSTLTDTWATEVDFGSQLANIPSPSVDVLKTSQVDGPADAKTFTFNSLMTDPWLKNEWAE
jgi:hypothetical protein